jgi:hypothetical protein
MTLKAPPEIQYRNSRRGSDASPLALLHPKARESLSVHLVTLKNLVWGGPEMSALLDGMPP